MEKYKVIYIGETDQLNLNAERLKKTLGCKLKGLSYSKDFAALFQDVINYLPNIIIIETFNVDSDFLGFLLLLKSHEKISGTKIFAMFSDKNNLDQYSDIYSFGVEYGFIAGEEEDKVISDLGIFLDGSKFQPIPYAVAQNIYVPTEIKVLAKVSHLTPENISIETSVHLKEGSQLEGTVNFGEEIQLKFFKIAKSDSFLPRSYFSHTADLKILFQGDPELDSEIIGDLTSKEDYLGFLSKIEKQSFFRNDPALIIDGRAETLAELLSELNVNNRFIRITSSYTSFGERIATFRPEIICYHMEPESDDMADDDLFRINGATTFNELILKVRSTPKYDPYVLVFNDRSRSQAYRKAYNYQKIIVNKKPFELDYLSMIIDEYQENTKIESQVQYLKPPDEKTRFQIHDKIIITSLSENKVTFLFDGELKDFTTFKVSEPLNIYVTVIPTSQALESKKEGIHYFGLISNTSEKDKMEIRKLVNLLIKLELSEGETFVLKSAKDLQEETIKAKALELQNYREIQKEKYQEEKEEEGEDA